MTLQKAVPVAPRAGVAEPAPGTAARPREAAPAGRLLALDAFRGLTVLVMLLVNNVALGRFTPPQLAHAPWGGGARLADLVFPWFLFCVGAAIPFAAASARRRGWSARGWVLKSAGRTAALLALGMLVTSSVVSAPVLGLGVLQLIGLAFLVGALLYPLPTLARLAVAAGLLVAYWAAIRFLPVPGVGAGVFEEDRNLVLYLNRAYLGPHLRGLLSVMPTGALVLIATAVGDLLRQPWSPALKGARLLAAGGGLVALALLWSLDLGFNKTVWTPSYILLGAGTATLGVGVLTLIVDAAGWRGWTFPLVVLGSNALLAYVGPILVKVWILQDWRVALPGGGAGSVQAWLLASLRSLAGPVGGGWLYTTGYILACWLALLWLYRRSVFLKV